MNGRQTNFDSIRWKSEATNLELNPRFGYLPRSLFLNALLQRKLAWDYEEPLQTVSGFV